MAEKLFDAEFLGQLEQLRLHFKTRASGQSGGGRQSKHIGVSSEFSDFREYRLGDDFRRVDWNAYARFDKLILKLFMEERQMHVRLFIDQSSSMRMQGKSLTAKRLALVMAYLALTSYDQVSIIPMGDKPAEGLGPITGKAAFMRGAAYLEAAEEYEKTKLLDSISRVNFGSGSGISYVFTDGFLQDSANDLLAFLRYNKQRVTFVHVLSRQELNPELDGEIRLIDSETGEKREIEISPGLLKEYRKTLKSFCADLKETCHRHGFAYEMIPADMDLREAVLGRLIN